jgi:serine/threonine protein kinase
MSDLSDEDASDDERADSASSADLGPGARQLVGELAANGEARAASNLVGKVIGGKYRIDRQISEGGQGVVYSATHTTLKDEVALKVVPIPDERARKVFVGEASHTASLDMRNIVRIRDAGEVEPEVSPVPSAYLALELLKDAKPIDDVELPVGAERARSLLVQVADALQYAHKKGIVHRDLTSNNVLVDGSGKVKLIDFGLSFRIATASIAGRSAVTNWGAAKAGTAGYKAPEQVKGTEQDAHVDVWAAGVILYKLLTGTLPFGDYQSSPPTPEMVEALDRTKVPKEFLAILEGTLRHDPQKRWTALQLFEALAAIPSPRADDEDQAIATAKTSVAPTEKASAPGSESVEAQNPPVGVEVEARTRSWLAGKVVALLSRARSAWRATRRIDIALTVALVVALAMILHLARGRLTAGTLDEAIALALGTVVGTRAVEAVGIRVARRLREGARLAGAADGAARPPDGAREDAPAEPSPQAGVRFRCVIEISLVVVALGAAGTRLSTPSIAWNTQRILSRWVDDALRVGAVGVKARFDKPKVRLLPCRNLTGQPIGDALCERVDTTLGGAMTTAVRHQASDYDAAERMLVQTLEPAAVPPSVHALLRLPYPPLLLRHIAEKRGDVMVAYPVLMMETTGDAAEVRPVLFVIGLDRSAGNEERWVVERIDAGAPTLPLRARPATFTLRERFGDGTNPFTFETLMTVTNEAPTFRQLHETAELVAESTAGSPADPELFAGLSKLFLTESSRAGLVGKDARTPMVEAWYAARKTAALQELLGSIRSTHVALRDAPERAHHETLAQLHLYYGRKVEALGEIYRCFGTGFDEPAAERYRRILSSHHHASKLVGFDVLKNLTEEERKGLGVPDGFLKSLAEAAYRDGNSPLVTYQALVRLVQTRLNETALEARPRLGIHHATTWRALDDVTTAKKPQAVDVLKGKTARGVLMSRLDDLRKKLRSSQEVVRVTAVEKGSEAERKGILVGDVIVKVAGTLVRDSDDVVKTILDAPRSGDLTIELEREGERRTIAVNVARRPSDDVHEEMKEYERKARELASEIGTVEAAALLGVVLSQLGHLHHDAARRLALYKESRGKLIDALAQLQAHGAFAPTIAYNLAEIESAIGLAEADSATRRVHVDAAKAQYGKVAEVAPLTFLVPQFLAGHASREDLESQFWITRRAHENDAGNDHLQNELAIAGLGAALGYDAVVEPNEELPSHIVRYDPKPAVNANEIFSRLRSKYPFARFNHAYVCLVYTRDLDCAIDGLVDLADGGTLAPTARATLAQALLSRSQDRILRLDAAGAIDDLRRARAVLEWIPDGDRDLRGPKHVALASLDLEAHDFSSAREHLRLALEVEPGSHDIALRVASTFREGGAVTQEARLWYGYVREISPSSGRLIVAVQELEAWGQGNASKERAQELEKLVKGLLGPSQVALEKLGSRALAGPAPASKGESERAGLELLLHQPELSDVSSASQRAYLAQLLIAYAKFLATKPEAATPEDAEKERELLQLATLVPVVIGTFSQVEAAMHLVRGSAGERMRPEARQKLLNLGGIVAEIFFENYEKKLPNATDRSTRELRLVSIEQTLGSGLMQGKEPAAEGTLYLLMSAARGMMLAKREPALCTAHVRVWLVAAAIGHSESEAMRQRALACLTELQQRVRTAPDTTALAKAIKTGIAKQVEAMLGPLAGP